MNQQFWNKLDIALNVAYFLKGILPPSMELFYRFSSYTPEKLDPGLDAGDILEHITYHDKNCLQNY